MKQHTHAFQRFSMLELVGAVAILGLLTVTMFGMVSGIKRAQLRFSQDSKAIIVLDNVVTQLEGTEFDQKTLDNILQREFKESDFPRKHELEPVVLPGETHITAAIRDKTTDRILAKVEIQYDAK